jgi:hypothetical protein
MKKKRAIVLLGMNKERWTITKDQEKKVTTTTTIKDEQEKK